MTGPPFRFNALAHEYIDLETGAILPHITGMLKAAGLVDDLWFTEESSIRGTAAHRLTADYDLGALDVASCVSKYRGYLLAHVAAMAILRPEVLAVEEPVVSPGPRRWAGRPDRVVRLDARIGVLEGKAAVPAKSHPIQTALQAILVAPLYDLPPDHLARYALYWKPNGKFKLEEHTRKHDYTEADRIIRRFAS